MSATDEIRKRIANTKNPDASPVAPLAVKRNKAIKMTVAEAKVACEAHPDHCCSKVIGKAIAGMLDTSSVTLDLVDVEAMLDGGEVEVVETTEMVGGQSSTVKTKRLKSKSARPIKPAK
tara:strand:- start:6811 stop:7167 length:357 start_codon:yes stop_codon:yes gene_type:complete